MRRISKFIIILVSIVGIIICGFVFWKPLKQLIRNVVKEEEKVVRPSAVEKTPPDIIPNIDEDEKIAKPINSVNFTRLQNTLSNIFWEEARVYNLAFEDKRVNAKNPCEEYPCLLKYCFSMNTSYGRQLNMFNFYYLITCHGLTVVKNEIDKLFPLQAKDINIELYRRQNSFVDLQVSPTDSLKEVIERDAFLLQGKRRLIKRETIYPDMISKSRETISFLLEETHKICSGCHSFNELYEDNVAGCFKTSITMSPYLSNKVTKYLKESASIEEKSNGITLNGLFTSREREKAKVRCKSSDNIAKSIDNIFKRSHINALERMRVIIPKQDRRPFIAIIMEEKIL